MLSFLLVSCAPGAEPKEEPKVNPRSQEIKKQNRLLVNQCKEQMITSRIGMEEPFRVNRETTYTDIIRMGDEVFEDPHTITGKYSLKVEDNELILGLSIYAWPQTESLQVKPMSHFQKQVAACTSKIINLFKDYGIRFDLKIDVLPEYRSWAEYDLIVPRYDTNVSLLPGSSRSNTAVWFVDDPYFCGVIIHEIGHYLGLNDEYPASWQPGRFISKDRNPYSLMETASEEWDNQHFFPRHIKEILSPVCPDLQ